MSEWELSVWLMAACRTGNVRIVRSLIAQGVNPSLKDGSEMTALHYASMRGHLEVVQLLSSVNTEINAQSVSGWTPLHYACWFGHLEVVQELLSVNAETSAQDRFGRTPLHSACVRGHLEVVQQLLSVNAEMNVQDDNGWTPLHLACGYGHLEVVKQLNKDGANLEATNNDGRTPLHHACMQGYTEVVKYLLREGHCNPNAATKYGPTPLAVTPSKYPAVIRELLRHGAHASDIYEHYGKQLPDGCPRKPTESAVKVFIVGKQGMGKSTLTTALKKEGGIMTYVMKRMRQVSGIEINTAGIIPHDIHSKTFGHATIYDFAGHEEFYSGHDVMLRSSIAGSPAVFLIVSNLSLSDEEFKQSIMSWLAFLENQDVPKDPKPHIIIVGSHVDEVTPADVENKEAIVSSLLFSSFHFAGFVPIDCRYAESPSMTKLRKQLLESCSTLRHKTEISVNCHCLYLYLLDHFQILPAIKVREAVDKIEEESGKSQPSERGILSCIPDDHTHLCRLLQDLHERGNILLLRDTGNFKNSWIILDGEAILSHVTGTVFAPNPEDFKKCMNVATSTGVVPFSKIQSNFPDLDSGMIVEFLCHFEFCHEVLDKEGQQLLQVATGLIASDAVISQEDVEIPSSSPVTGERFFFFPHLLKIDVPGKVWEPSDEFTYYSGWILECSDPDKFLTHRFLHVLLLRLAFAFALAPDADSSSTDHLAIQRKCSIWKNGIHCGDRSGTEALVEVVNARKIVNVLLRCTKYKELECVRLRSSLIQKIVSVKNELCSAVPTRELFVHPSDAACYPLKSMVHLKLVSCAELATATIEAKGNVVSRSGQTMDIDMFLYFEPYAHLGERILQQLFDQKNSTESKKVIRDGFLQLLAEHIHQKNIFIELFKPSSTLTLERLHQACPGPTHVLVEVFKIWRDLTEGSYHCLHKKLDQYSVFTGRNPLRMVGQKPPCLQEMSSSDRGLRSPEELQGFPQRVGLFAGVHPLNMAGQKSPSLQEDSSVHPMSPEGVDQTSLDISMLSAVNSELVSVAPRWMDLGLALGLDKHDLESLESNYPRDVNRCLTETLARWLQQVRTAPSWKVVVTVLSSPPLNRCDLAHSIAMRHGNNTPSDHTLKYSNVNSEELGTSSLRHVVNAVFTVYNWFSFGLALGVSYSTLKTIEADNPRDTHQCRTEMLTAWLKRADIETSWRTLAQALDSPLVGKAEIATMIVTEHRVEDAELL